MPSRQQFDEHCALYEEAVAMYEAAREQFLALQATLRPKLSAGNITGADLEAEERAGAALFIAKVRLSRRKHRARMHGKQTAFED